MSLYTADSKPAPLAVNGQAEEIEALRKRAAQADEYERIICMDRWTPQQVKFASRMRILSRDWHRAAGNRQKMMTIKDAAVVVGLGRNTVAILLQQFAEHGLMAVESKEKNGRNGKPYFETTLFVRDEWPAELPIELKRTPAQEADAERKTEERREFAELRARLKQLGHEAVCPGCKHSGTIEVEVTGHCTHCEREFGPAALAELIDGASLDISRSEVVEAIRAAEDARIAPPVHGVRAQGDENTVHDSVHPLTVHGVQAGGTEGGGIPTCDDDRVTTRLDTLQKLYDAGAEFCRVHHRHAQVKHPGKQPFGDGPNGAGWKTPCPVEIVAEHLATGCGNAGVLTESLPIADADADYPGWLAYCARQGRPMTKLFIRRDDLRRGKCAIRVTDPHNLLIVE